ncbi:MAG: antibiotic biosynthesis monooxygenase [Alphaproteobacteria bacterium]|nr:MAG: antibiotic biosynthesis monooxygenase [Alphaproteobacteria bacterium]
MIVVIFEVRLRPERREEYFDLAAHLRPMLEEIDGFISVERFASLVDEGKTLSLSFWRDEAALEAWRRHPAHRAAQRRGRNSIFADYRLRVGRIERDYGMHDRAEAPSDAPS